MRLSNHKFNYIAVYFIAIILIYVEVQIVNEIQIVKWKYFIWQGEYKELNLIIIWNILNLSVILLYFLKLKVYEKYVAPLITIGATLFLLAFPFILNSNQKTKLATAATFNNENLLFMDFVDGVKSSICRFNESSLNTYCAEPKYINYPYSDLSFVFQFIPLNSSLFIAFIINFISIALVITVVRNKIGISGVPMFILSPWFYFVLERSNLDLLMLACLLLLSFNLKKAGKITIYIFALFLIALKPIFAGFLLTNKVNQKNILYLIIGITTIIFGYDFSLRRLQESRGFVDPTPYGAFGLSEIIDLLRYFSSYTQIALISLPILIFLIYLFIKETFTRGLSSLQINSFNSRVIYLLLIVFVVGNQVNYKLILLFPLLLFVLTISDISKFQVVLILFPSLGLISIGQHTIMRGILILLLTIGLTTQVSMDLLRRLKSRKSELNKQ